MENLFIVLFCILPQVQSKITPELLAILEQTLPDDKVLVIVHMNTEYPYSLIQKMTPSQKCVIFRDIAYNSQKPIIEYLKSLPKEKIELGGQFWIFNGFHLKTTKEIIKELANRSDVWFICENGTVYLTHQKGNKFGLRNPEWNIQKVMADSCWSAGFNGNGIIIGHIDTGVDVVHPALDGKWLSPFWLDAVNGQTSPYDDHGHGTHTMGIICGGDGPGPFPYDIGVAYGAKFIPTKGFCSYGYGEYIWIDSCMQYLADLKLGGIDIRVIGNSWGTNNTTNLHWWSIIFNWKELGVLPVFSNGNCGPRVAAPASYPTTIGVGATDINDNIAFFSNPGPAPNQPPWNNSNYWYYPDWNLLKPDLSAPGVDIRSCVPGGGYDVWSGTSMASPHITGGVALLLQKNSNLNLNELYEILIQNCDYPTQGQPYPNYNYGWGRVNLWHSLQITPYPGTPDVPTIVSPFDCVRLPDLHPSLKFYSIDPDNDSIRYLILWDTDPDFASPESSITSLYPSGIIVNFVIPVTLLNGETYWWKVKCQDLTGAGQWTRYTIPRSFTIDTALPLNTCSWFQTKGKQFGYNYLRGLKVQGDSVIAYFNQVLYDTLFEEHFEDIGVPLGWTVIDGNNDGYKWTVGTTDDLEGLVPPNYGTQYAYYSDDDAGAGVINYNEEIHSPPIYTSSVCGNLMFVYGYGFRINELVGEKFRVKMRKFSGNNWSNWFDLRLYTNNGYGNGAFNLNSYLPADSVQFSWFYSDSSSSSHWGWACAFDNVILCQTYPLGDSGKMIGVGVDFHSLSTTYPRPHWGDAVWHKATPDDSIGIQIEYFNGTEWQLVPESDLPGNSAGFYTTNIWGRIALDDLDTTIYQKLRLVGLFYQKNLDSPSEPALLDWELGNLENYGIKEEKTTNLSSGEMKLDVCPNPFTKKTEIRYEIRDERLMVNGKWSAVSLKIYDAGGRLVKQWDYETTKLSSRVVWNGTDDFGRRLPAGVYFCELNDNVIKKIRKIIIVH